MSSSPAILEQDLAAVVRRVSAEEDDIRARPPVPIDQAGKRLADTLLCTSDSPHGAEPVFDRLRWGGQVIYVSRDRDDVVKFSGELSASGFEISRSPASISSGFFGLPFLSRKTHFVVGRKVSLLQHGKVTDRFTYNVHLERQPDGTYVVAKEVPGLPAVIERLRNKWPELPADVLDKRARKFTDKIFPIFLTREAAILKIVNRDLPDDYRDRVPKLLSLEQCERGYARKLRLNWLRNGGEPLRHLEFARQAADLLRVLHDRVGVMHLDLRLDNFVVTPRGVGFVDFGSAVRVDEDLKENPLLAGLFQELMRTSAIQKMLLSMTRTGEVTSQAISKGLHKVDKAVDFFQLAVQINAPHANPDLRDLIVYDKKSDVARMLAKLTDQILRPPEPSHPAYRSAADILRGIERIELALTTQSATA